MVSRVKEKLTGFHVAPYRSFNVIDTIQGYYKKNSEKIWQSKLMLNFFFEKWLLF